ncbi:NADH dehydrogenase subunit 2 (mitochondrion) [Debaryomyces hansenii]|uniref:NADH-ubiquinone oxidoreductase chain 2 n=1 Tax=Debaryomyces hansenii (strain ATCC 36239 / CBS 767 / BCRC 21394 / JCM 1990 / NBRC 0083 / IGC 2968) TaxID=284592 RepID=NU2M_DEBHA|nr:NADH dehydrogenase subunit 2 [Debaryomyces hansenii]A9RAG4.1 RecName: Full=NADH-ubiquinone oxidoreductase chain 2; AltName: Full=NADH dehydrogenase subunit 2 [Debaryomyces hansenii CBS767]ABF58065.1 NADH dehydrogenase subunit 2 [Debaryomyces hansenii]|eukprot:YP_001621416.1 NADH dehydrogenase subunit 2 (mitochondrion) [Debaryomyces hansenii]
MTFTAFTMFLVFSTFSQSMMVNRTGTITIMFTTMLFFLSMDIVAMSPGMTLFNNWFNLTPYNLPLSFLMLSLIVMLLMYSTSNHRYDLKSPFYLLLLLTNMMGLLLFPLVNDLIALYVVMELQSYSLYLLTGLHSRSYNSSRASLLYFLMGGVASTIMLLASYFVYALTGTTNLSDMAMFYSYSNAFDYFDILLVALLFKMGMAPLHRWSIAVYNYAPTYITAYISMVAKMSMVSWIFANANLFHHHVTILFFYISLAMAAYKPLFQVNIKTMLAYSGMLNFSYILLSMMSYDPAFYIYMIQYVLTHLILFLGMLGASQYVNSPISIWSPLTFMHQLKLPNLTLAFSLILALFSLIGMPPTPGFYAKLFVLSAALQDNYVLETCAIVVCSVVATYYYANMIKVLFNSSTQKVTNFINPSLAFTMASATSLLFSFFMFMPSLSEGLYLITL